MTRVDNERDSSTEAPSPQLSVQQPSSDRSSSTKHSSVKAKASRNSLKSPVDASSISSAFEETQKSLVWKDIEVTVPTQQGGGLLSLFSRKGSSRRQVLHGVSGIAEPGELLAIMGESGAGKTTLLNILTRRNTKGLKWTGEINVNGDVITDEQMMRMSAYVQQVDMFCGNLTVKEHLSFSAHLRMHPRYSYKQRKDRVKKVLEDMGLVDCQNTKIALRFGKSLSMGEMKRLSFASEVLTDPSILFCDEPTSGLDAFMARQVVTALRRLARRGKTIVMTIHQPSSQVYDMFDKLCLMSLGKVAYLGPANEVCDLFADAGHPLPPFTNPADHVIHTLATSEGREEEGTEINIKVRETFEQSETAAILHQRTHGPVSERRQKLGNEELATRRRYAAPWFRQLYYCTKRSFLSTLRDPLLLKVRLIQVVVTSAIIGFVNFQTTLRRSTVMNFNGVLFNAIRDMQFMFMMPCIHVFTSEIPVFLRENQANIYRTDAYFLGKNLAELPQYIILPMIYSAVVNYLVGLHEVGEHLKFFNFALICVLMTNVATSIGYAGACVFGSTQRAIIYIPMFVVPLMVFGGFYVRTVPLYFMPLQYLSWFRYGFEGHLINKWADHGTFPGCDGVDAIETCNDGVNGTQAIERFEFRTESHWIYVNVAILIAFMTVFRIVGIIALQIRSRFSR